ncbi:hypothetical protein CAMRE0001_3206 [Campylobacter rectus RM3267]|uniref:Uncharacterized protein n=1 Tax=Campylobacter rectus RM3267 TaxID=553218 RepID=B9D1B9_CAMRE|nr:hypothetical protein CAMRE0001_3206 [Campylobacter rectus RM3267]
MITQNGLKLLGGRVNSLECVYKDKSGFDYSFSLDGQILNIRTLQSPLLPVNGGDETLVVCDKKERVLGLKNRSLNSAAWYAYEPSSFLRLCFSCCFCYLARPAFGRFSRDLVDGNRFLAICYLFLVSALLPLLGLNITARRFWAYALGWCSAP